MAVYDRGSIEFTDGMHELKRAKKIFFIGQKIGV
jgi:hypothetical protein